MKMINIENLTADELSKQRGDLVSQIAAGRIDIAEQSNDLNNSTQMVNKIFMGILYLKAHPSILLFPVALTAVLGFRRVSSLVMGGLGIWRMARQLQEQIQQQSTRNIV